MSDINRVFWCSQCGPGARSQEDGTCSVCGADIILPQVVSAIARAAAEEERRSILHETGSTVTRACAALVRLSAPDDVDDAYVPRAAVVDIAIGIKRDMDALRAALEVENG
jgi:hypothetical protein